MKIYSIIMFVLGIILILVGIAIYKEKISIISFRNKEKLRIYKREEYAKRCALSIFILSASMLISGLIYFVVENDKAFSYATTILLIGIIVSFLLFGLTQSKYKSGLF